MDNPVDTLIKLLPITNVNSCMDEEYRILGMTEEELLEIDLPLWPLE